jgi:hypothetical protein
MPWHESLIASQIASLARVATMPEWVTLVQSQTRVSTQKVRSSGGSSVHIKLVKKCFPVSYVAVLTWVVCRFERVHLGAVPHADVHPEGSGGSTTSENV